MLVSVPSGLLPAPLLSLFPVFAHFFRLLPSSISISSRTSLLIFSRLRRSLQSPSVSLCGFPRMCADTERRAAPGSGQEAVGCTRDKGRRRDQQTPGVACCVTLTLQSQKRDYRTVRPVSACPHRGPSPERPASAQSRQAAVQTEPVCAGAALTQFGRPGGGGGGGGGRLRPLRAELALLTPDPNVRL